ncbi:TIGR02234 family membrane protein [Streptomyces yaizuensis]|uniref:TIGR02234 family membrane protein n=1 Tax=Streptomyces yaizuensis TaxID=2989713 RepID=A0ABQ5NV57_9ACTN|nr:TIGR02234 family membrane protein [Streptomyces sp. YSPA8]
MSAVPVPQPRATSAEAQATAANTARRSLAAALLLGGAGAAVVLLTAGQTWAEGSAAVVGGALPLTADGSEVTGLPTALAIVSLAALVAVFAVRGSGRILVSALLALCGAGAGIASFAATTGGDALDDKAATTTGDTAAAVAGLTHTAWPYVSAAGAALLLVAGLIALRHGRHWPAMSGRYERDGSPRDRARAVPADPERPEELWKALDRGEDPTDRS